MIKPNAMRAIIFSALCSYLNRRKPITAWLWFIAAGLIVWGVVKINAHTPMPDGLFSAILFPRFVVMLYAVMGWATIVNNLLKQDGTVVSKLLPSLRPSLRATLTLGWFVISFGVTALFYTADRALLEGWVFSSSFLTIVALAARFDKVRIFVFLSFALSFSFFDWQIPNFSVLQEISLGSFAVFALTIGCWLLTQRYLFDIDKARANGFITLQPIRNVNLTKFYRATIGKAYAWSNWRLFRLAINRSFTADQRIGLVFGGRFNNYRQIVQCFYWGLIYTLSILVWHYFVKPLSIGVDSVPLWAVLPLFYLFQGAPEALNKAQHDLKIVSLLPGVPHRKGLNKLIYKMILKHNLIYVFFILLLQTLLILALPTAFERPIEILAQLFSLGLLMSTIVGFPGYAIQTNSSNYSDSLALLVLIVLGQILNFIGANVPTAMIVVLSIVCSAFIILNGLKTYANAPKILPFQN
jgi:hypothetical protein